jgi:hypothetical protein
MTSPKVTAKSLASYAPLARGSARCHYTPGPWFQDGVYIETAGGIQGDHIATVPPVLPEWRANAVLIAAAPELADALRALLAAQQALNDTGYDIAACQQNDSAEAAAVALLARLDGIEAGKPESAPLSDEG